MTPLASPLRRRAAQLLALACLASVLAVVPLPRLAAAHEVRTKTTHIALAPRLQGRGAQRVSAEVAAEPAARAALQEVGRRTASGKVAPFEAIGITLPSPPAEPVLVRGRVDGTWSPWFEARFDQDEAPDQATEPTRPGAHSQPVWLGGADAYEIDAPGAVAAAEVHLVTDVVTQERVTVQAEPAGAAGAPAILSRSAWGARPPRSRPVTTSDLKAAIVHHSVNSNSYSAAAVPALLRSIQAYHQDVNGWADIAYNFAVDRFGRVWEARAGGVDQIVLGGHSAGFNTGTVGVVVLGDFTAAPVPAAAVEGVAKVIAWKLALHRVDPAGSVPYTTTGSSKFAAGTTVNLGRIVGHRDVQSTGCPGNQLYSRLGAIRTRVAQLVPQYQAGLLPTLVGGDLNGDGLHDGVEHHPGPPGDALWPGTPIGQPWRYPTSVGLTYRPVVGDLDGNGYDDVVWHGAGRVRDVIWWDRLGGFDSQALDINASYVPFVGDFDGNGLDDVLWYSPGLTADAIWYLDANRRITGGALDQDLISGVPVIGDFDGDGRDDIFWYGPGTADDEMWWSSGRGWRVTALSVNGWYTPAAVHDATAGRDRILMVQPGSSTSYRWEIDGARRITSRTLSAPGLAGALTPGDFDGDGREDVLIYAPGSGRDAIWYSTATGVAVKSLTLNGTYAVTAGRMDLGPTDDVLLVDVKGTGTLWRMQGNRTIIAASG